MSVNTMQSSQLQRRPGRRRSNPSPTSPSFPRRHGRPSDLFCDRDAPPALSHSESPSIDLKFPSPTFNVDPFSPAVKHEDQVENKSQHVTRLSADYGRHRPRLSAELHRPATSGAGLGLTGVTTTRTVQSPDSGHRNSPGVGIPRDFGEIFTRSTSRDTQEDGPGPTLRTFSSPTIQTERALADEFGTVKTSGAKRSRLNLLNPMSLLARRKSSQNATKYEDSGLSVNTLHVPAIPDNLDPSIRGTIVHDFSVPRNRRINNENSPHSGVLPSPGYPRRPSDVSSPPTQLLTSPPQLSAHSPYFREHFQDDRTAVDPTNTAYLHANNLQAPSASNLPKFAKRLPLSIPEQQGSLDEKPLPPLSQAHDEDNDAFPPPPDQPPPPPPKRTPSPVLNLPPPSSLPKHMTSTSSRFSFQLGGQGSLAQEKLLEERHKKHALKRPETVEEPPDDDFGDYDYEADDFEERIPGVNADFDDDDGFDNDEIEVRNIDLPSHKAQGNIPMAFIPEFDEEPDFNTDDIEIKDINQPTNRSAIVKGLRLDTNHRQSLQAFHFTPDQLLFSPTSTYMTSEPTPRDAEGFAIGLAESQDPALKQLQSHYHDKSAESPEELFFSGLRISTGSDPQQHQQALHQRHEPFDDNDLYFDDGEFDHDAIEPGDKFDESWLDDESGKIHDIPAENARKYGEALNRNASSGQVRDSLRLQTKPEQILPKASDAGQNLTFMKNQQGLTEDNLAAYHDALAFAANKAAEDGKFDRSVSFDLMPDDGDSPFYNSQPAKSSNGSRHSNIFHSSGVSDDDAFGFDDDDDMDDEAMIAAANAEALENDDEGVYGQEFGFYARARGKDTAELINGGYFSSRGSNGVKRSHSGKANFQEPSLTPITERSEWSTRNSVASLPIHGGIPGSAQSLPSPGIAQLLELDSPLIEDEMTLSALLKLRRGAFGGSQSSINSMGDRHNSGSSPLAHVSGYTFPNVDSRSRTMSSPVPAMTSSMSIAESEDEDEDIEPPTMVQNTPQKKNISLPRRLSQDIAVSSPMSRTGGSHHSRASSGGESVSYARESDGRWVLERRRTGDSGEVELVDREYLAADARI